MPDSFSEGAVDDDADAWSGLMHDADAGQAHVWIVPLTTAHDDLDEYARHLSPAEHDRCARLQDPAARLRFLRSRHALRTILAERLGRDPASLVFLRGERGKPAVQRAAGLDFSFSDCRDCALIAIATAPTGVDGEHERAVRRPDRTAHRIFHPDTAAALEHTPRPLRTAAFLAAWTQREAHVKAVGGGLFHTADVLPFEPLLPADARPRAVHERASDDIWSIARFSPSSTTIATLAVRALLDSVTVHRTAETADLHIIERTHHERA
jgi:4'-phosphopantetheinyl transferase